MSNEVWAKLMYTVDDDKTVADFRPETNDEKNWLRK